MSIFLILPGDSAAYSPLVLGLYLDQIVRKVDPQKRGLGEYFRTEIAEPFGKWGVKERKKLQQENTTFCKIVQMLIFYPCIDLPFKLFKWLG